jgi:hypothetical protein
MNKTIKEGKGGELEVALDEAWFVRSNGVYVMVVPVARYQDGKWQDGGNVYTSFDYDGMMEEAERWAHDSVRSAHNTGEGT